MRQTAQCTQHVLRDGKLGKAELVDKRILRQIMQDERLVHFENDRRAKGKGQDGALSTEADAKVSV